MDDQYSNGNDQNSIPAYQMLEKMDAAKELNGSQNIIPVDVIPRMDPMSPIGSMSPVDTMGAADPIKPMDPIPTITPADPISPVTPMNPGYAQPVYPSYPSGQAGAAGYMPQQQGAGAAGPVYAQPPQYNTTGPVYAQPPQQYAYPQPMQPQYAQSPTKFCKFCAAKIPSDAVICTSCGRQVENLNQGQTPIVINNTNDNVVNAPINVSNRMNMMMGGGKPKDKWVAFILCFFFGALGAHKFYEEKIGMGILYLFTGGLCGVGWLVDLIMILLKPNPYYV